MHTQEVELDAFEMWLHRRMLKISWKEKVSNIEVLSLASAKRELTATIIKKKWAYLGHIIR